MDRKELYQAVKDRNAYMLFRNLKVELSAAQLDGTNTHKAKNLIGILDSTINLYKEGDFPKTETMAEYKTRNKELFEVSMKSIMELVENYHLKI